LPWLAPCDEPFPVAEIYQLHFSEKKTFRRKETFFAARAGTECCVVRFGARKLKLAELESNAPRNGDGKYTTEKSEALGTRQNSERTIGAAITYNIK
jgi:hypothetical protein